MRSDATASVEVVMAADVVSLVVAGGLPRDVVGGKAGALGELAAAGFPVPAGFVVTAAAAPVARVVAAAAGPRVAAYRIPGPGTGAAGGTGGPAVAVLVQQMVDAAAAGVAFTADPVTGARDVTVVTAVRGLGDRLVAGEA